jgi:hypothetical protein
LCRLILRAAFERNEAVFGIPRNLIPIGIGDDAAATRQLGNGDANPKGFSKKLLT